MATFIFAGSKRRRYSKYQARSAYMRTELRLHRLVVGILVALLGIVHLRVLALSPTLAHQRFEVIVSLVLVITAAAVFVMIGMVEGVVAFQFGLEAQARTTQLPPARHGFACLRSISGHLRQGFYTDNSAGGGSPRISLRNWRTAPCGSPTAPSREQEGITHQWIL